MRHHRESTTPSFTRDYPTFMTMLKNFGAGTPIPCVECGVAGTRVFYLYTTRGKFLWGAILCEEHHRAACEEANARLTHPVREIRSLGEVQNN